MDDPVQFSIEQFAGAWRLMCRASRRAAMENGDGLELIFSGLPVAFFNVGLVTGRDMSAEGLASSGRRACEWAAAREVPWLFVVTHETLADGVNAAATLDAVGLAPLMPLTGMSTPRIAPTVRVPEGLQLTTPADDAGCAAIVAVNGRAYAMELDAAGELIGTHSFWQSQFPVVALKDGVPAACAAVMMVEGCRYVALVATEPAVQRRGYADAAMRQALMNAAAAHGERPTVLHATAAGRPMYERMGYTTIANHTVFMEKRFLEEH